MREGKRGETTQEIEETVTFSLRSGGNRLRLPIRIMGYDQGFPKPSGVAEVVGVAEALLGSNLGLRLNKMEQVLS